jgi:hypothetical protein
MLDNWIFCCLCILLFVFQLEDCVSFLMFRSSKTDLSIYFLVLPRLFYPLVLYKNANFGSMLSCILLSCVINNSLSSPVYLSHPVPSKWHVLEKLVGNFPSVVSPRGTSFISTTFSYDVLFGKQWDWHVGDCIFKVSEKGMKI